MRKGTEAFAQFGQFKRGGPLDAQVQYGGTPAYANYVYGVYLGAAGWDLPEILSSADAYGKARSVYPPNWQMGKDYPHIPQVNVDNITRVFSDQKTGNLCTVQ